MNGSDSSSSQACDLLWQAFDSEDSARVEFAWRQYTQQSNPQDGGSKVQVERGRYLYELDFEVMKQTNLTTGRSRCLRRREAPADARGDGKGCRQEHATEIGPSAARVEGLERELRTRRQSQLELEAENARLNSELEAWHRQSLSQMQQVEELRRQLPEQAHLMLEEMEMWRKCSIVCFQSLPQTLYPRPHLKPMIHSMLQSLVPRSHTGHCRSADSASVDEVQAIFNHDVWKRYCLRKQEIAGSIQSHWDCPWVRDEFQELRTIHDCMQSASCDVAANEVMLLHGTDPNSARDITKQGFDHRLSGRDLYGPGVYFTADFCKALQYCKGRDGSGRRCLMLSRVTLGHPFLARGPMQTHKRPPSTEQHGIPHDSIIARRGISNGSQQRQVHLEFVVPEGNQAYPELLVWLSA